MEKTLHKDLYIKDEWFQKESSKIFQNEWFCVARNEDFEVPGDFKLLNIAGESIFLLLGEDKQIRSFFNLCKHRGCQLLNDNDKSQSKGNFKKFIRCPYHSWTYNLDGSLRKAPHLDLNTNNNEYHLNQIMTQSWGGFLFIKMKNNERSLTDQVNDFENQFHRYGLENLKTGSTYSYIIDANWKVILENYNECYHCAGVHPELCKIVPEFTKKGGTELDWEDGIPQREGTNTFTFSGTTNRPPIPGLNDLEKERHFGELIYPNLMISLSMDHAATFIVNPLGPEKTLIDCRILFHQDAINMSNFNPNDAGEFWDLVNIQDWSICERVQKGMQSMSFEHGFYGPMEDQSKDIRIYIANQLGIDFE